MKVFSKCHIFGCLSNKWLLYHNLSQTPCTSPLGYWPEVIDRVTYLLRVGSERKETKSFHSNYRYVNSWYAGVVRKAVVQEPLDIIVYDFVPQTTGLSRKLKSNISKTLTRFLSHEEGQQRTIYSVKNQPS